MTTTISNKYSSYSDDEIESLIELREAAAVYKWQSDYELMKLQNDFDELVEKERKEHTQFQNSKQRVIKLREAVLQSIGSAVIPKDEHMEALIHE